MFPNTFSSGSSLASAVALSPLLVAITTEGLSDP